MSRLRRIPTPRPAPHKHSLSRAFLTITLTLSLGAATAALARTAQATETRSAAVSTAVSAATRTVHASGTRDLEGLIIVLDPGHNGDNGSHPREINRRVFIGNGYKACDTTGTSTRGGYAEHRFNWDVTRRVQRLLVARGADVRLTHPNDHGVGPCINQRARIGNRAHAVVALSIHADGGPENGHGFHVIRPTRIEGLTDDIYVDSRALSTQLRKHLRDDAHVATATYVGNHGIDERGDLGGLNLSDVPKCFVELGNMRNSTEAHKLARARYRQKLALALAHTLGDYAIAHAPA